MNLIFVLEVQTFLCFAININHVKRKKKRKREKAEMKGREERE